MEKIALLPGGFKPPHAGHYNMAKWLASNTDASTILIKVGAKERDGITREMSLKLWDLYRSSDKDPLAKKLTILPSNSNSPVKDVYDFIEQDAPEESIIYLGVGKKDFEDKRFANISKFSEPKGIKFFITEVPPQSGGVSGTDMRDFIKGGRKEEFNKFIPDHLTPEQKEEAWSIVTKLNEIKSNNQATINGQLIPLEIMVTPEDHMKGMMGRDSLDGGMLFPYGEAGQRSFHMKNCLIPLDIVFITQGEITNIHPNCPPCLENNCPQYTGLADNVLELEGGYCEKNNINVGDYIKFPTNSSYEFYHDYAISNDPGPKTPVEPAYKYKRRNFPFRSMYESRGGESEMHVYDFDETIARALTPIPYTYTDENGEEQTGKTTSKDFEETQEKLQDKDNVKFDFKAFEKQIENAIINDPVYNNLIKSLKNPNAKTTVLTARTVGQPVTRFLKKVGLDAYVEALGGKKQGEKVTGQDKADWIEKRIKKTTKRIYFIDDADDNRAAVNTLKDKYPNIQFDIENPPTIDEMMVGTMNDKEMAKHNKAMKNLRKDLNKINKGDDWVKIPKNAQGTLTRKLYEEISSSDLDSIEDFADKKLDPVDVDLTSDHFFDRLNDPRNEKEISNAELIGFFKRLAKKKKELIDFLEKYKEIVASDDRTNINIPFLKQVDKIIAKTIMRKKDFQTSNPQISLNEADPKKGTGKKPKGSGRRLYTDEDPSDTVKVKFSTRQDVVDTLNKKSFKSKPHKRQSQIINLIHQRVRAALSRTKDPQKKKRLKSAFEYIKKRKEASKKKTQRMKKENALTKEWWKEIINEILLTEGGAAGHMAHPFDLPNVKSGEDLKDIFVKAAVSLKNEPGSVKIDGVNSSIRLVDLDGQKQFVMDRGSKKPLDLKGITKADLEDRFKPGHGMIKVGGEVLDMFNEALPSLKNDLQKLGAWDNPNILFNMEYVSGKTNVQDYGSNFIAIHGLNKMETKEIQGKRQMLTKRFSTELSYDKEALQSLLDNLKPIAEKRGYKVYGSVPTEMAKEPNFNSALSKTYTVNLEGEDKTQSLDNWLSEVDLIPKDDFIFINVNGTRKKAGAVSKQVYQSILKGDNVNDLVEDENDIKKAIDGFVTYLATEKLGDEILKVLDSPMGSVEDHEGVVIRDKNIYSEPFKITGKFILGGLTSDF